MQEAHEHNLSTFDKLTGRRPDVLAAGFYEGVRAVPADRMPLAGRGWTVAELEGLAFRGVPEARSIPRAPGLWICAGFGSRGLTWGLACARHVAADVTGDVQALPDRSPRSSIPRASSRSCSRAERGRLKKIWPKKAKGRSVQDRPFRQSLDVRLTFYRSTA